ncbi:MAG: SLC13 family permease [Peptococcaceae bacterium]
MNQSMQNNPAAKVSLPVTKNSPQLLKWIISLAVPLIIMLIPASESYTPMVKGFLAITFWGVFSMATEILPSTLVAVLLPVFYILFKVGQPAQAFAPWTSTVIWISFGGIIIANVLMTTGLAKRIAYFTILKAGGSFAGTLVGLMLAGIIINPFVPSVMGKMAMIVPIAIGVCQALELEPKSRGASAVMITAFLAIAGPRLGYLTGDGGIPMMMNIVSGITKITVSWSQFAYHNLLLSLILSAITVVLVIVLLKPEKKLENKAVIIEKYNELGVITAQEKKAAILLVVTIAALVTDSIHGIDSAWVFMMIGLICFLPKIELINDEQLGKLNYKILFFVAGCMSIGTVANGSGAGKWLADILFPYLAGSPLYTTFAAWFSAVALNFVLTPLAALASFTGPITEVCVQAGINPLPVIYSFLMGVDQYILPYEFAGLLFVYSYGYIAFKDLLKVLAPRMMIGAIFMVVIAYPYWKLIGLYQ